MILFLHAYPLSQKPSSPDGVNTFGLHGLGQVINLYTPGLLICKNREIIPISWGNFKC